MLNECHTIGRLDALKHGSSRVFLQWYSSSDAVVEFKTFVIFYSDRAYKISRKHHSVDSETRLVNKLSVWHILTF